MSENTRALRERSTKTLLALDSDMTANQLEINLMSTKIQRCLRRLGGSSPQAVGRCEQPSNSTAAPTAREPQAACPQQAAKAQTRALSFLQAPGRRGQLPVPSAFPEDIQTECDA